MYVALTAAPTLAELLVASLASSAPAPGPGAADLAVTGWSCSHRTVESARLNRNPRSRPRRTPSTRRGVAGSFPDPVRGIPANQQSVLLTRHE